jgi:hypothetical protein
MKRKDESAGFFIRAVQFGFVALLSLGLLGCASLDEYRKLAAAKKGEAGNQAASRAPASMDRIHTREDAIRRRAFPPSGVWPGMSRNEVRRSLGTPDEIEVSGKRLSGGAHYERWIYKPHFFEVQTKVIYFRKGRVSAWERL